MWWRRGGKPGPGIAVLAAALLLADCSGIPSITSPNDGAAPSGAITGTLTRPPTQVRSGPRVRAGASVLPVSDRSSRPVTRPDDWAPERRDAVTSLVTERFRAQAQGSREGWLARVSGDALRAQQAAIFDRMAAIRVTDLHLVSLTEVAPPTPAPPGQRTTWNVRATVDYGIHGFQAAPRTFTLDLRLMADPSVPETTVIIDSRPGDRPQPWDLHGMRVRRSTHSLVLGVGASSDLDEILRRADSARRLVAAVWGSAAPGVIIAPATDGDAARLLGAAPRGLTGVAAVTDGPLTAGRPAGSDRIVLVPGPWRSLTGTGREVVLTHELTHVAVRSTTTRAVPLWLSEGFAEYVAYRPVRLPESTIVAPLLEQVRHSGLPSRLPGPEAFAPSRGRPSAAYGKALCAVRAIADRHGEAALVRFYRAAAGGLAVPARQMADPEAIADDALRVTLSTSRSGLEGDVLARIVRLVGS